MDSGPRSETGAVVVSAARAPELGPWPDPGQSRPSCSGAWSHTHGGWAGARVHAGAGRAWSHLSSGQQRSAESRRPGLWARDTRRHVARSLCNVSLSTCAVCPEPGCTLLLPGIPTNI